MEMETFKLLRRVLIILISCISLIGLYYDWNAMLGIYTGIVWGLANFYFIKQLVSCFLMAKQKNYMQILLFALIKFPLLYLVGYGLLSIPYFSPWNLLIGFSIALIVIMQRGLMNPLDSLKQT